MCDYFMLLNIYVDINESEDDRRECSTAHAHRPLRRSKRVIDCEHYALNQKIKEL